MTVIKKEIIIGLKVSEVDVSESDSYYISNGEFSNIKSDIFALDRIMRKPIKDLFDISEEIDDRYLKILLGFKEKYQHR